MTDTAIQATGDSGSAMFAPQNLNELKEMANMIASSNICPKDFVKRPVDIIVASQFGAELGLGIMASLQGIAVINGRPSVWGDAMLALVLKNPNCGGVHEEMDEVHGVATCTAIRSGRPDVVRTFSIEEAKTAGLWGRNVWKAYPNRMLQMRARGFALRDQWADVLKGISLAEEQRDKVIHTEATVTDSTKTRDGTGALVDLLGGPPKDSAPTDPVVKEKPPKQAKPKKGAVSQRKTKPVTARKTKPGSPEETKDERSGLFGEEDEDQEIRGELMGKIRSVASTLGCTGNRELLDLAADFLDRSVGDFRSVNTEEMSHFLNHLQQSAQGV